jgi:hypothetical protein
VTPLVCCTVGEQCWCGTFGTWTSTATKVDDEKCNTPCTGNIDEKCGGPWYIDVTDYSRNVETTALVSGSATAAEQQQYQPVATYSVAAHQEPVGVWQNRVQWGQASASVAVVVEAMKPTQAPTP